MGVVTHDNVSRYKVTLDTHFWTHLQRCSLNTILKCFFTPSQLAKRLLGGSSEEGVIFSLETLRRTLKFYGERAVSLLGESLASKVAL